MSRWKDEWCMWVALDALMRGHTVHFIGLDKTPKPIRWVTPRQHASYEQLKLDELDDDPTRQTQCWTCPNPARVRGYCRDCWDLHTGGAL